MSRLHISYIFMVFYRTIDVNISIAKEQFSSHGLLEVPGTQTTPEPSIMLLPIHTLRPLSIILVK